MATTKYRAIVEESNGVRNIKPLCAKSDIGAKREARGYAAYIGSKIRLEQWIVAADMWLDIAVLPVTRGEDKWVTF